MTPEAAAIEAFKLALVLAPHIVEAITETGAVTLDQRIERARAAVKAPLDWSKTDEDRREEMRRIIRGMAATKEQG